MRRLSLLTLVAALLAATALPGTAPAGSTEMWHVKITNLTTGPIEAKGQPMSPPLWAVHDRKIEMWSVGELASSGMLPIVEDALNAPFEAYLDSNRHVREARTETGSPPAATPGPIPPGGTREFDVTSQGDDEYLSMAWMLVRSNDAFTGLDSYELDGRKGKTKTLMLRAYDGGTENNNESCATHIPGPPCSKPFVRDPSAQAIAPHPGLTPGGALAAYAWTNPVAKVQITRTH